MKRGKRATCATCGQAGVKHYDGAPHRSHVCGERHQLALLATQPSSLAAIAAVIGARRPRRTDKRTMRRIACCVPVDTIKRLDRLARALRSPRAGTARRLLAPGLARLELEGAVELAWTIARHRSPRDPPLKRITLRLPEAMIEELERHRDRLRGERHEPFSAADVLATLLRSSLDSLERIFAEEAFARSSSPEM